MALMSCLEFPFFNFINIFFPEFSTFNFNVFLFLYIDKFKIYQYIDKVVFFCSNRKIHVKTHIKSQGNSKLNLEKEQIWGFLFMKLKHTTKL